MIQTIAFVAFIIFAVMSGAVIGQATFSKSYQVPRGGGFVVGLIISGTIWLGILSYYLGLPTWLGR